MEAAVKDDYGTILAVPCDQPIIVSREIGDEIRRQIKQSKSSRGDKNELAEKVRAMFGKPGEDNGEN